MELTDRLTETTPYVSEWRHFLRVFLNRKLVIFGVVVILLLLITAIFAPLLAPYDPYDQNLEEWLLQPSWEHLLGTDSLGRDTLSRLIYGSRDALLVGVISVGIASTAGMTIGLIAGYFGGWVNSFLMRFVDALMCFPIILLALVISALLGEVA
jgi:ABC-type dipeptide/oligopeptide/nickel transport system permease subunit